MMKWWFLCVHVLSVAVVGRSRKYSEEEYGKIAKVLTEELSVYPEAIVEKSKDERKKKRLQDELVDQIVNGLSKDIKWRLDSLLESTKSDYCRKMVTSRFGEIYSRLLREETLPFETEQFKSECTKQAPGPQLEKIKAEDIRLAYLLLVHEEADQVIRLIESLNEVNYRHSFVIHVDAKSNTTYRALRDYVTQHKNMEILEIRTSVNWGGFNVVKATLLGMDLILQKFDGSFDWIVTLSGYTYPLVSNKEIRKTLANFPADTEFAEIRPQPNEPQSRAWHLYVECDDEMRRIWRMMPPTTIKMYMGSQWMLVTRDFARYVVGDPVRAARRRDSVNKTYRDAHIQKSDAREDIQKEYPRGFPSFAAQYERYAQYTMVADENFFVTVLKNSPMCHKHYNDNFLHVQFDQWENEKPNASKHKCLQPNPKHCGRSPTTLTLDYMPVLELGGALFARKFDPRYDAKILNAIDIKRTEDHLSPQEVKYTSIRIVWRPQHLNGAPSTELCLQVSDFPLTKFARDLQLKPCKSQEPLQHFDLGPCSTDGHISIQQGAFVNVTPGRFAPAPFCPIASSSLKRQSSQAKTKDDESIPRSGLCLDLERESIQPGTPIIAYACSGRWNQLFGFGSGLNNKPAPGSVYINIPYPYHIPKELCLETVLPKTEDYQKSDDAASSVAPSLKVSICDPSKLEQAFQLEFVHLPSSLEEHHDPRKVEEDQAASQTSGGASSSLSSAEQEL